MTTLSRHIVAVAVALSITTAAIAADPAPEAKSDALSRKTLDRWAKLEHRPSRSGLAGGSVELVFEGTSQGRPLEGKGTYTWDSSKDVASSSLKWEPASLGRQLSREGWSCAELDRVFLVTDDLTDFRGCSLTATSKDGQVVVSVKGKSKSGIRQMTFDSDGLLVKKECEINEGGFEMKFSLEPVYSKRGKRYVKASEVFRMNGQWGDVQSKAVYAYAQVDGVLLPSKVVEVSTWNGQPAGSKTVSWTQWKIRKKKTAADPNSK